MRYLSCFALFVVCAGCGDGGPAAPPLYPVTGELVVGGKPLPNINVQLAPVDLNAKLRPGLGKTDAEGKFTILTNGDKGANPGKYKVVLTTESAVSNSGAYSLEEATKQSGMYSKTGGPPKPAAPPFPPQWSGAQTSPKEVEITNKPEHIKIDI